VLTLVGLFVGESSSSSLILLTGVLAVFLEGLFLGVLLEPFFDGMLTAGATGGLLGFIGAVG
jgi:hypothetical protein